MSLPDGPKGSSWIQTVQFFLRPLETLDVWHQMYGDTFRVLGNELPATIFFSNPEAIQKIFTATYEYFESTQNNNLLKLLLGENSILSYSGEQHQRQKRILLPPFHSERMRDYSQVICEITEKIIGEWIPGKIFVVNSVMKEISIRIILDVVFGLQNDDRYNCLKQLLVSLFDVLHHPFNSIFLTFLPILQKKLEFWRLEESLMSQLQQIDKLVYAIIAERKVQRNSSGKDILSMLLEASYESGEPLTNIELRDSLMTLLFAGYETTSSALSWALYWSYFSAEIHKNLLFELNSFPTANDKSGIAQLPYLSAVCSETLRFYPISLMPFSRFVQKPIEIMGYQLEPDTIVNVSIYLAHQREQVYPQPKMFRPERFLERQFSPYEYLPFGGGSRRCIGAALAQLEIKLVLATILSRLQLGLVSPRPMKPIRRGLIMVPPTFEMVVTGVR
ncbi:cytochrome P450 [Nostoc sp. CHAB 5784]|uniref:cytochrome P450 n=1 Tax=Nostoc mirabile TaxID=2907820 RepID=UPI002277AF76|nr:cytochrome P450 [Nostoc mirabile]MCC5664845.1 cytochrome P450 [Nostoc mirabile CHAB5784]